MIKTDSSQTPHQTINTKVNRYFKTLQPYYKLNENNDDTLQFESRFESGNLRRVI